MASAIPRPCSGRCGKVTTSRFCEQCAKRHSTEFERWRANDPIRKLYRTATWRRTRMDVLMRDPVCKACGHAASSDADHIVPAREYKGDFCDMENLQGLCHACHSAKTATEVGWAGNNRE